MGMFDSVWVKCPKCNGDPIEVQTKGGRCLLEKHQWETLSDPTIADAVSGEIVHCTKCDCYFELLTKTIIVEKECRVLTNEEVNVLKEIYKDYNHIWE